MTILLHAQPYDISATGFYFETVDQYRAKARALRNAYGAPVEEFELQFIDDDDIDCALASAINLSQANIALYFSALDNWDRHDKLAVIIAVGDCGYCFDGTTQPGDFDIDIYEDTSLRELAEHFVDEGLFGGVPASIAPYIDYDAVARDLSVDYTETTIAGTSLIYRCS